MNGIKFKKMEASPGYVLIRDFRKHDVQKLKILVSEMFSNLNQIRNDFTYNITVRNGDSLYKGGFSNRMDKLCLDLSIGKFINKVELEYPKLMFDNCFILNGSTYVPILFSERAPIDRIKNDKLKKNSLLLNLLCEQLMFDFKAQIVRCKNRTVSISEFMTAVFNNESYNGFLEQVYVEFGKPIVNNRLLTTKECITKVLDLLNIQGHDRFSTLSIADFFDKYMILSYEKEILQQFYGYSNFRDIIRICYQYYKQDVEIDMSDIRNRRIVMIEYLMYPIFQFYNRILYNFIDSSYKEHLIPTLKNNALMSEGFRERMKGEQLFNVTLPYITPAVHKISQHIVIIDKKVPKKWTSNHPSAMGILCPISVSAQNMGSHLMATMETELTIHGKIKSFAMPDESDIRFNLEEIPEVFNDINLTTKSKIEFKGEYLVDTETGEVINSQSEDDLLEEDAEDAEDVIDTNEEIFEKEFEDDII